MMFANDPSGRRVTAQPGAEATCPACRARVIPKCGPIKVWHWAHFSGADCDKWAEPLSLWRLAWQRHAPSEFREVVVGAHRADLRGPAGHVVLLQPLGLSAGAIAAREAFYGPQMGWLWDATEVHASGRLEIRPKPGGTYATFRWRQPHKAIAACTRPVFLDLGNGQVFRLWKIHPDRPCGGWGHLQPAEQMRSWFRSWRRPTWTPAAGAMTTQDFRGQPVPVTTSSTTWRNS